MRNDSINSLVSTATAAGTTVLAVNSAPVQEWTGTTTQTETLPIVTTLWLGWTREIINNSTGAVTINSSGGNTLVTLAPGTTAKVRCINISTGTGIDRWSYTVANQTVSSGTNTGNETAASFGSIVGTAGDATPNDNDYLSTALTAGGVLKKITWTNAKAFLKTYFDTLYQPISSNAFLLNDFRLTLTSGTPVTVSDVTGTTVHCCPYVGNRIALYDGSAWNVRASAEFSIAMGTVTSGRPYDMFCYDNAGTPTLEILAWTSDTARATALAYQDGILVKSGAATRRYLGSFYTISTTQTRDTEQFRYLWNYYNRRTKRLFQTDATVSWTYSTAAWRQAGGDTANDVNFMVGVAEDCVSVELNIFDVDNNVAANVQVQYGLGLDSVSAPTENFVRNDRISNASNIFNRGGIVSGTFAPVAGKHYVAWLEYGNGANTQTWYSNSQSGLSGTFLC